MGEYSGRRVLLAVPTLLLVTFTTFVAFHLVPYGPTAAQTGDQLRQELGLNGSIWSQYATWLGQLLHFNLGRSYVTLGPVWDLIGPSLGPTLLLDGTALLLAAALSLLIRSYSANRNTIGALLRVGAAIPPFVLGLVLIYIFAIRLQRLPVGGYQPLASNVAAGLSNLILPAVTLGLGAACITVWLVRLRLLPHVSEEDLSSDRSLRSVFRSRDAILSELPLVGLQAGVILAGTFVIEPLFGWPGIGSLALDAIYVKDYPTAQGIVLLVALAYLAISVMIARATAPVWRASATVTDLFLVSGGITGAPDDGVPGLLTLSPAPAERGAPDAYRLIPKWVPAAVLGAIVAAAVLFPLFYEHIGPIIQGGVTGTTPIGPDSYHSPTYQDLLNLGAPFSGLHPLGTDALGRDMLARVIYGARATLGIGALSAAVAAAIGLLLGALEGSITWLVDLVMNSLLAFPAPLLALAILADAQLGLTSVVFGLAIVQVPIFARYARELARVRPRIGTGGFRGLVTELIISPNLLLAPATGAMALAILWESMLSFLGFGLPAPTPDWGGLVSRPTGQLFISPVELVGPSLAIVVTLLTLALVAENAGQPSVNEDYFY